MSDLVFQESGVLFGGFPEENVFEIEKVCAEGKKTGVKAVEFVLLADRGRLMFVEAKTSCPNKDNMKDDPEKEKKYSEYYQDLAEKFVDSIEVFAASKLGRFYNERMGKALISKQIYSKEKLQLVLVITGAEESWLPGPQMELEYRLRKTRSIWNANVIVLNLEGAKRAGLIRGAATENTHLKRNGN